MLHCQEGKSFYGKIAEAFKKGRATTELIIISSTTKPQETLRKQSFILKANQQMFKFSLKNEYKTADFLKKILATVEGTYGCHGKVWKNAWSY